MLFGHSIQLKTGQGTGEWVVSKKCKLYDRGMRLLDHKEGNKKERIRTLLER